MSVTICGEEIPLNFENGKLILPEWLQSEPKEYRMSAMPTKSTTASMMTVEIDNNNLDSWMCELLRRCNGKPDSKERKDFESFRDLPQNKRAEIVARLIASDKLGVNEEDLLIM